MSADGAASMPFPPPVTVVAARLMVTDRSSRAGARVPTNPLEVKVSPVSATAGQKRGSAKLEEVLWRPRMSIALPGARSKLLLVMETLSSWWLASVDLIDDRSKVEPSTVRVPKVAETCDCENELPVTASEGASEDSSPLKFSKALPVTVGGHRRVHGALLIDQTRVDRRGAGPRNGEVGVAQRGAG